MPKKTIHGTPFEPIVKKYAVGVTKSGGEAKSYTLLDVHSILNEAEAAVKEAGLPDLDDRAKIRNFIEAMGYAGYSSGIPKDRRKLYVTDVFQSRRRSDGSVWAYIIETVSVGTGRAGKFTVVKGKYDKDPIREEDLIWCEDYHRDKQYYRLDAWHHLAV